MGFIEEAAIKGAGRVGFNWWRTIASAGKVAIGGAAGRMAVGGVVGGIYGAVTNPYNNPNMALGYTARAAAFGAALGGATRLVTPAIRFGERGITTSGMPLGLKALGALRPRGTILKAADVAMTGAGLAIRNPTATLGLGIGAYAFARGASSPYGSPSLSMSDSVASIRLNEEAQQIDDMNNSVMPMGQMSSGSMIRNQRLMQSTVGLVNGLHAGRHG